MPKLGHAKKVKNEEAVMGLTDHLREFRNRLAIVIVIFVVVMLVAFTVSQDLLLVMLQYGRSIGYNIQITDASEQFVSCFRLSLIAGLAIDSPFILYELFAFASPGLKKNERQFLMFILLGGLGFFVLGALFAYNIMIPFMLQFFLNFNKIDFVSVNITVSNYIALYTTVMLALGCVFEMPIVVVLLTQLGLLRPEWMVKARRVAIVCMFFLGACITPPDVVSQVMVACPMILLYQLSIFLSRVIWKRKLARNPYLAEEEAEAQAEREREKLEAERKKAAEKAAAKAARKK